MKAYLVSTGAIFGVITLLHIWRVFLESQTLLRDPLFWVTTLLAAGFSVWAFRLLRVAGGPPRA
jgi:hypothetical protein